MTEPTSDGKAGTNMLLSDSELSHLEELLNEGSQIELSMWGNTIRALILSIRELSRAEAENARLKEEVKTYDSLLQDFCEEWKEECEPDCNSETHAEECDYVSLKTALRKRRERAESAERDIKDVEQTLRDYGHEVPGWIEHSDQDGKLRRDTMTLQGTLIFILESYENDLALIAELTREECAKVCEEASHMNQSRAHPGASSEQWYIFCAEELESAAKEIRALSPTSAREALQHLSSLAYSTSAEGTSFAYKDAWEADQIVIASLRRELADIAVAVGRSKDGTGEDCDWHDLSGEVKKLREELAAVRRDAEPRASSRCPMDGIDTPHAHDRSKVVEWLKIQAEWALPGERIYIGMTEIPEDFVLLPFKPTQKMVDALWAKSPGMEEVLSLDQRVERQLRILSRAYHDEQSAIDATIAAAQKPQEPK